MRRATMSLLAAAVLASPHAALAQEDGVTVDQDSPTAKEYAIPLDAARRRTDASKENARRDGDQAPLFGEGVQADDAAAAGSSGGSGGSGSSGSGQAPSGGAPGAGGAPSAAETERTIREATSRAAGTPGGSGSLGLAGIIAAVVCAGAAATGFALRRRGGPSPA